MHEWCLCDVYAYVCQCMCEIFVVTILSKTVSREKTTSWVTEKDTGKTVDEREKNRGTG